MMCKGGSTRKGGREGVVGGGLGRGGGIHHRNRLGTQPPSYSSSPPPSFLPIPSALPVAAERLGWELQFRFLFSSGVQTPNPLCTQ